MSKTAEWIRLLTVITLSFIIVGMAGYFVPRFAALSTNRPMNWEPWNQTDKTTSTAERAIAATLEQSLTTLLEQTTGTGRVRVSVWPTLNPIVVPDTPPTIARLAVSVIIDGRPTDTKAVYQPRSRTDMSNYTDLIKAAIGFDAARGDTLSVQNLPFTKTPTVFGLPKAQAVHLILLGLLFLLTLTLTVCFILPVMHRLLVQDRAQPGPQGTSLLSRLNRLCRSRPDEVNRVLRDWLNTPLPTRHKGREYSYPHKAAIILLTLAPATQRALLRHLPEADVRRAGRMMTSLGRVTAGDVRQTINRFIASVTLPRGVNGTTAQTHTVFQTAFDPQKSALLESEMRLEAAGKTIWDIVQQQPLPNLVACITKQSPENGALIVYRLPPETAAAVLELLPEEKTARLLLHVAHLKHIKPATRHRLEQDLIRQLSPGTPTESMPSGTEQVGQILTHLSPLYQDDVLSHLTQKDPATTRRLALSRLTWTDLATWQPDTIRQLIPYLSRHVTAIALHNADTAVVTAFKNALPTSQWQRLGQEIAHLSPADIQTTPVARETILKTIRELVKMKKLTLPT